jgi:hypothetical protein
MVAQRRHKRSPANSGLERAKTLSASAVRDALYVPL